MSLANSDPRAILARTVLEWSQENVLDFGLRNLVAVDMELLGFRVNIESETHRFILARLSPSAHHGARWS